MIHRVGKRSASRAGSISQDTTWRRWWRRALSQEQTPTIRCRLGMSYCINRAVSISSDPFAPMRTRFGLILKITERTKSIPSIYHIPTRTTRSLRVAFCRLLLLMRQINDENAIWTDSEDYGLDEILYISKITLLKKNNPIHKRNYHSFQGSSPIISSESSQNFISSR